MQNVFVSRALAAATIAWGVMALGCDREHSNQERPKPKRRIEAFGSTVTSDRPTVPDEQAVQGIVDARCDRETRRNNVGQGKPWASAEACKGDLPAKNRHELRPEECPSGAVRKELDECLADIRKEACDSPLDTITRLAACRSSDLCKAAGM